jgi:hypothetical protein
LTYKLHTATEQPVAQTWSKTEAKNVGGITKHGATFGIKYCRCNVVVQKMYNINL